MLGASGRGSWTGAGAGFSSFTGGLATSGTTGVVLGLKGGGESAGDGVLLEDCRVSLLVRPCCNSALICFMAGFFPCTEALSAADGPYVTSELPLSTHWAEHLLMHLMSLLFYDNPRSQQQQVSHSQRHLIPHCLLIITIVSAMCLLPHASGCPMRGTVRNV